MGLFIWLLGLAKQPLTEISFYGRYEYCLISTIQKEKRMDWHDFPGSVLLKDILEHLKRLGDLTEKEAQKVAEMPPATLVRFLKGTRWGKERMRAEKRFFVQKWLPKTPLESVVVVGPPLVVLGALLVLRALTRKKKRKG